MSKLEEIKKAFEEKGMLDVLPSLAYNAWCTVELGKSFSPTVDMLDDLYVSLVSGVLMNLGSGKTPEYMEEIGPSQRFAQSCYEELWTSLVEIGMIDYTFEEWLKNNPESDNWGEWIEESIIIENSYRTNPEKWLIEFRAKLVKENKVLNAGAYGKSENKFNFN